MCDYHALARAQATGERGAIVRFPCFVIPNLAVGAIAVPAEVAVRDRFNGKKLKTAKQRIVLRHFYATTENSNRNQFSVRLIKIVVRFVHFHGMIRFRSPSFSISERV